MDIVYLTVKQAAERLNVIEATIRQYIKTGKLKAVKQKQGLKYQYLIDSNDLKLFDTEQNAKD